MTSQPDLVLDIRGVKTVYRTPFATVRAVDGIDLAVERGSTLCIVGESGSGKSAIARSILQLVDAPGRIEAGVIDFRAAPGGQPINLLGLDAKGDQMRAVRGKQIAMIFQEPMSSLSPVHSIGNQIAEMLQLHEHLGKREARDRAIEELHEVGMPDPERQVDAYTFQLSGGMRQRAMIAMALSCRPQILIADEPTTALDVTTQAQILDLLRQLKDRLGMTLIFITHDLGVVAEIADQVAVMKDGQVVEFGAVDEIFHNASRSYTRSLLANLPQHVSVGSAAAAKPRDDRELLRIDELQMHFSGKRAGRRSAATVIKAVDGISLSIRHGETFGLVGESGCGKTTLGRCIVGAYRPTAGRISYRSDVDSDAVELTTLNHKAWRPYRGQVRMVFQDPYGSLNPRLNVGDIIAEPLYVLHRELSHPQVMDRVRKMLEMVGLRPGHTDRYPHAFSGGERQRISIARALITRPQLVIADEAVSALDMSIRGQVLRLLAELQAELDLTYIFISHDLSVVQSICDRLAVMRSGRVVEHGTTAEIYDRPQHPYTRSLLSAVPLADPRLRGSRQHISYQPDEADGVREVGLSAAQASRR